VKGMRDFVTDAGVRGTVCEDGEKYFYLEDTAKWLLSLDPASCSDPEKGRALAKFQAEASMLNPAAQFRKAVEFLDSLGAYLPDGFRTLPPKAVKS
jgi:hypothetical protein